MTTIQIAGATLASVLVTRMVARVCIQLAPRLGFVAQPTPGKDHGRAVPLLGGVAMAAGYLLSRYWLIYLNAPFSFANTFFTLIVPMTVLPLAAGLLDDRWALRPLPKLLLMMGVAAVSAWLVCGAAPARGALWFAIFLVAMNSFNLLDNSDGACATVACCCMLVSYAAHRQFGSGNLLIAGALLGFLTLNWPPARIFMGDAGSLMLGIWCAKIVGPAHEWHLLPVLWVPLYDTLSVMLVRAWHGRPVWIGGQDHCAHRLQRLGLSAAQVNLLFGGATLAAGVPSIWLPGWAGIMLTIVLMLAAGTAELFVHRTTLSWRRAQ